VFPPLVPEGEPESLLGKRWKDGRLDAPPATPTLAFDQMPVAYSPDGKSLASGSSDNTVRLWDVATGNELRRLEGHADWVWSVAFSPDGKSLASGSSDNTVRLWDVAAGKELRRLEGHAASVLSVAFSPDGKSLASGSYDKTVRLWGRRHRQRAAPPRGPCYRCLVGGV